ncbi:MAG: NAD-dependent epimerase/dehydratase family protein [bacterium]
MNNVLVIGGTTFFGLRIVEKLVERGDQVTVFSRGQSRPPVLDRATLVTGDRNDPSALRTLAETGQFDAVIDNIAFTGEHAKAACESFRGNAGQYIVCSSVSVYRYVPRYRVLYEPEVDLARRTGESYGDGKRALEQYLWDHLHDDLPVTVFRPTVVEGPRDPSMHVWFYLQRFLDGGPVLLPNEIPDILLRIVFAEDVADAFVAAVGNPTAHNRVYNLGGEEVFTLNDYADMVRTAAGSSSEMVNLPIARIREEEGLADYRPEFLGFDSIPDIAEARRDLGYRPAPVQQRIAETVEWIRSLSNLPDSRGYTAREAEVALARRFSPA